MKKYGFFGGSFNPVTNAHIHLALEIINNYSLDKIIFVPMGDLYEKENLLSEKHRFNMLKIATSKYNKLEISDIELNQEKNLTTLEAFQKLEKAYSNNIEKTYIIGADNLNKFANSEDAELLMKNYKYIVVQREGINCYKTINENKTLSDNANHISIMNNEKYSKISSSEVRNNIENLQYKNNLLDDDVLKYIKEKKLYLE